MVPGKRVMLTALLVVVIALVGTSAATATVVPIKILGGRADQIGPAVNAAYLGYTSNTRGAPNHYDAYVRSIPSGTVTRLNTRASGWFGGIRPDANEAIYQQYNRRNSGLHVIDLDTMTVTSPGTGVNTSDWEYDPSISQDWILFGRITSSSEQLILYDRVLSTPMVLDSVPYPGRSLIRPGNITGKYATWTKCGRTSCNVFAYDLVGKSKTRVPNPDKHYFYFGSASDTSNKLYFVRSGNGCGVRARIQSWDIGTTDPFTTVVSFPTGYDVANRTFTFVGPGSHDDVYYDQIRCAGTFSSNIFEAPSAETA